MSPNSKDRPRRLRASETMRNLVRETQISPSKLCAPLFVKEGKNISISNKHVPTMMTYSLDRLSKAVKELSASGIRFVLLFGVATKKDAKGSEALKENGIVIKAIQKIRDEFPEMLIGTDIALDPYTNHGHDGLFEKGKVLNDATIEVLKQMAILHAEAGAHIVAPSDMMDGRVAGIRKALEAEGFEDTSILAYTAKYASCLYGPFRDVLDAKVKGDKKTYQMDPANRMEALKELRLDLAEGADMVMVKPASWYLDIISDFKMNSTSPIAAYQVSGECAMIELAVKAGIMDRKRAIVESAQSIFRAGADMLVTYFAKDIAESC